MLSAQQAMMLMSLETTELTSASWSSRDINISKNINLIDTERDNFDDDDDKNISKVSLKKKNRAKKKRRRSLRILNRTNAREYDDDTSVHDVHVDDTDKSFLATEKKKAEVYNKENVIVEDYAKEIKNDRKSSFICSSFVVAAAAITNEMTTFITEEQMKVENDNKEKIIVNNDKEIKDDRKPSLIFASSDVATATNADETATVIAEERTKMENNVKDKSIVENSAKEIKEAEKLNLIDSSSAVATATNTIEITIAEKRSSTSPYKIPNKKRREFFDSISFTPSEISEHASDMFANVERNILNQPCVSARLFACVSLILKADEQRLMGKDANCKQSKVPAKRLQPLIPLLQALVQVEGTCLGGEEGETKKNTIMSNTLRQREKAGVKNRKRVQFSGFDCSSAIPPVDSVMGSHSHQRNCIDALFAALQKIKGIVKLEEDRVEYTGGGICFGRKHQILAISVVVAAFKNLRQQLPNDILKHCAKSIASNYHPQRIAKAMDLYQNDFESILNVVRREGKPASVIYTHVEYKLAELLGQAIRFHLRMMLNARPTTNEEENIRAVHDLVSLEISDGAQDSAAADGFISSLFSSALSCIYDYFGFDSFLSLSVRKNTPSGLHIPTLFFDSDASKRGLGRVGKRSTFTAHEIDIIRSEVEVAYSLMEVSRACRFLRDLFGAPGVKEELKKGWESIQEYSMMILSQELWTVCPQDAHFLFVTSDLNIFVKKIKKLCSLLEPVEIDCKKRVEELNIRFYTGCHEVVKQRKYFRQKYPVVQTIAQLTEEGMKRCSSFPKILPI